MSHGGEQHREPSLDVFLPSLETARAALPRLVAARGFFRKDVDLWQHAPREERQVAAIVLVAQALRRTRGSQTLEQPSLVHSAYRGAATVRAPQLHGTCVRRLTRASHRRQGRARAFDGLVSEQLVTFTWPLSRLVYEVDGETIEVALFTKRDETLAAAVAPARGEGALVES